MPEFSHDDRRMIQETHDMLLELKPVIVAHTVDLDLLKRDSTEYGKKLAAYDAVTFTGWRLVGLFLAAAAAGAAIIEVMK